MFIFTYSGYSFIHSSKFFESPQFSHLFSFCTKTSPDHVTVTSHPKWRLIVNFLKNSHSFSEYSIFTYSFALLYILYIVYFVFRAILFHKCHKIQIFFVFFSQLPTILGSLWILPELPVLQFLLARVFPPCLRAYCLV